MSTTAARVTEATGLVDVIGPLLNGHSSDALISALSALLATVIHRHTQNTNVPVQLVVDVVCRRTMMAAERMACDEATAVRH